MTAMANGDLSKEHVRREMPGRKNDVNTTVSRLLLLATGVLRVSLMVIVLGIPGGQVVMPALKA